MKTICHCVIVMIALVVFSYQVASVEASKVSQPENTLKVSIQLKSKKIAILRLFPLPEKAIGSKRPHERVFTGEFYSETPEKLENVAGKFIPNDYLEIIRNNFDVFRVQYDLNMEWIDNLSEVGSEVDIVLIGSVLDFGVNSNAATVEMAVRIIAGPNFEVISDAVVTKRIERSIKKPITFNQPFHTLGALGSDFFLERYLLNLACYQSIQDLINTLQEKVR